MMSAISRKKRQRVAQQALFRCGYCLTQEIVSGVPLTIEHLIPKAKGGDDTEENLWLSCRLCNEADSGKSYIRSATLALRESGLSQSKLCTPEQSFCCLNAEPPIFSETH